MPTFKAEVYTKKKDGTYNIAIRITHNRKKKYIPTNFFATKDDLTRRHKIKNPDYIDKTKEIIDGYREKCNKLGYDRLREIDVEELKDILLNGKRKEQFSLDIIKFGKDFVEDLKKKQPGTASNFNTALNKLMEFTKREKIDINEINKKFLNDWIKWIADQPAPKGRGKGSRSQSLYVNCLGFIHQQAKNKFNQEDEGIILIPRSPFSGLDYIHIGETRERAIDIDKIKAIAELPYETVIGQPSRYNLAKDVFIMSFVFVGMNAADLWDCKDYSDGRITYNRVKTRTRRKDKAKISIKVEKEVQALVDKYRDPDGIRVFNFYKRYSTVNNFNKALNIGLKQIGKNVKVDDLEFYAARHTWATYAINVLGIDKYIVHTALNHVDEEMKVTDMYVKKSWDPIDRANRQVLDSLNINIGSVAEPVKPKSSSKKKKKLPEHLSPSS
ncbi:MAG: phage integrase SAM-like domain-containing protein [Mangrovibacterium sp.]